MKSFSKRLGILIIAIVLIINTGCSTGLKTFDRNWEGLTDGEVSYSFLPREYSYGVKLKKLVGYVDGGNAVYASEDGLFIKENESLLQDMKNSHLVRTDYSLPVPTKENCAVAFGADHELSDGAKDDFFLLLRLMERAQADRDFKKKTDYMGRLSLRFYEPEGLLYSNLWEVGKKDGRLYLTDRGDKHALISESTRLYAEIMELSGKAE